MKRRKFKFFNQFTEIGFHYRSKKLMPFVIAISITTEARKMKFLKQACLCATARFDQQTMMFLNGISILR